MRLLLTSISLLGTLVMAGHAIAQTAPSLSSEAAIQSAPADEDDWKYSIGVPGWLAGLKGDIGVRGLSPVHVDVPFSKILEHLDFTAALSLEAQHGRWGFFADGLYLKVSADGPTPGPLLNSVSVSQSQVLLEAGVAYRLWQGRRGYFDLLVGARYNYIDGTVHLDVSSSGVQAVSEQVSNALVNQVTNTVKQKVSGVADQTQAEINNTVSAAKSSVTAAADATKTAVSDAATAAKARVVSTVTTAVTTAKNTVATDVAAAKIRAYGAVATAESTISTVVTLKDSTRTKIVDDATAIIQDRVGSVLEKYPHLPTLINRSGPVSDAIRQLVDARIAAAQAALGAAKVTANDQIQSAIAAKTQAAKITASNAIKTRVGVAQARVQVASGRIQEAKIKIQDVRSRVQEVQAKVQDVSAKVQATTTAASAQVRAAASRAQSEANRAVADAEKNLAKQIATAIKQAIPEETSGSQGWVDPFVGFRARYNLTDNLYLSGRADIGGFGLSSKLTWQAVGALGYQFNRHWSSELGYRYLSIDYENNGFVYDAAMAGAYVGITYSF